MFTPRAPYLPTHDRSRLVPACLLSQLERHTVAVVTGDDRAETAAQRAWLSTVAARVTRVPAGRWRHPRTGGAGGLGAFRLAARRAVAEFCPDLVHLEGAWLAPLAREVDAPVVIGIRESGVRRARDARRRARTTRGWIRAQIDERIEGDWERRWLPRASACVVASDEDRRALAEHVPLARIEMIPPGVDTERYGFRRAAEPARMVFAGNLTWPAHLDAADRLATRVLPRVRQALPQAELLVTGAGPLAALRALAAVPGVRVAGAIADLRPILWSAAVALVPAQAAPGVDAGLLEAMAVGTPVVAARACLNGLAHVLPGHHVAVAESDAELAAAALLVLREPVVAATLAENARQLIERHHTWAATARLYEALWARAADTAPTAVAA
jgi:glycosyltransferase involved in cell wall biosynthesis